MKKFHMGIYKAFFWKGINQWGRKAKGIVIAENNTSAENEARKLGVTIHYFKERPYWRLPNAATGSIKIIHIVFLMRQLSTLISAGVPLVQGLNIISAGTEKVKLRALLLTIRDDVVNGKTLTEALTPYPYLFDTLICGLINAGELSGTLDKMIAEVATTLEHTEYLKNRIKRALYYPISVLSIAVLVSIGMLVFLVPRFEKIYTSFNAKLPAFTLSVVALSKFVQEDWWIILMGIAIFIFLFKKLRAKSILFQRLLDSLTLNLIIFGLIIQKATISRICSTLAVTLTAGIPLIDALARVSKVVGNSHFQEAILHTRELVSQGETVAHAMRSTQMFPAVVTQMVEIGEKSGTLDHMFAKVGDYYRDQVNTTVEGLTTLIEPILIVVLGVIVGTFIVAMYLPIFNLGMAIKA